MILYGSRQPLHDSQRLFVWMFGLDVVVVFHPVQRIGIGEGLT